MHVHLVFVTKYRLAARKSSVLQGGVGYPTIHRTAADAGLSASKPATTRLAIASQRTPLPRPKRRGLRALAGHSHIFRSLCRRRIIPPTGIGNADRESKGRNSRQDCDVSHDQLLFRVSRMRNAHATHARVNLIQLRDP